MSRIIRKIQPTLIKLPDRKRVAAYARVSLEKDSMLQSLSAQVSYYSELIQKNPGWHYVGVYADEALTGTKAERPEFQRLLEDCRSGLIDMVITKSISRFARNTVTLLETVRELKLIGVDVFFEKENIHSMSGDGELMLTILASYAQEESRSVSENCKWRIQKRFKAGIPCCFSLLGYRQVDGGKLEIIQEEAEIVKRIFYDYLRGMGKNAIMKALIAEGIQTKRNGEWTESTLWGILRNEKYIGDLMLQKVFYPNHLTKKRHTNKGELPKFYVSDHHEPIIDRDTFMQVQAELLKRAEDNACKTPASEKSPFTGLITCVHCGKHYKRKTTRGKEAWNCSTYLQQGKAACHAKQIPEDILLTMTTNVLGTSFFDEDLFHNIIKELRVPAFNRLVYVFHDGHEVDCLWQDKSRSDSWDENMRQQAAETTRRRYGK